MWKAFAASVAKTGANTLANALLPGSPVVGQIAGMAASEILASHLGVDHSELAATGAGAPELPPQLVESVHRVQEEIEKEGGFTEIKMPKNFSLRELEDHECHQLNPPDIPTFQESLDALQALRDEFGRPMRVTSGWRSLHHSLEIKKPPDALHRHYHAAFDIGVSGPQQYWLLKLALEAGWCGIGVKAHGPMGHRFLHLDRLTNNAALWSYP